jgi:alpha,alpha-trehalase
MKAKKTGDQNSVIDSANYKDCLKYIEKYWKEITCSYPRDQFTHLGLPNRFISPNHVIYRNDQFYWDSYFIILGLVKCGRTQIAKGMVNNFLFLQKRFNIIPMRNRFYNIGSSQIPFLSSMAREVFNETGDKAWLKKVMVAAEKELNTYWMNKSLTEIHIVYQGLSRYCDHYITHLAAEHESGWDMTSRFNDHCLDYLPIDLNCCLYKYETDLAEFYKSVVRNKKKSDHFILQSEKRRRKMNSLMWNFKKGFYFDYNYHLKKQSTFYSVAGFYPLWAKMATHTQAKKVVDNLDHFEYAYGVANSQKNRLSHEYKQHDYPNAWPQQQWIIIKGLMNYGFRKEAMRLAVKYLDVNKSAMEKSGLLWEKYNAVTGDAGKGDRYPTQSGFGWTNAIFIRLLDKFSS